MSSNLRRIPLPDLFAQSRGQARRSDTEWESVMVQITLAFVIILGYLLSQGMANSKELAKQVKTQKKQNAQLSQIISDFSQTEAGRERVQRIAVQRRYNFLRLLNRWLRVKDEQRFHTLAQMYNNATLVELSNELHSLPVDATFQELNAEVERIFSYEKGIVNGPEVTSLLNQVLIAEGVNLQRAEQLERMRKEDPQAYSLLDSEDVTPDDIDRLRNQIVGDMGVEREKFVRIQLALIDKIFAARLKKLAERPLEDQPALEMKLDGQDLGRRMLDKILDDLRSEVQLLQEAEIELRGSESAETNEKENP